MLCGWMKQFSLLQLQFYLLLGYGLFRPHLARIPYFNLFKQRLKDQDPHTIVDYRIYWISDTRIDLLESLCYNNSN